MDVVWLILDSVSFEATSFCDDGPNTMPKIAALAEKNGIVFDNAFSPGPSSPSSHSAFFTGELPSKTGMHEAHPYFDGTVPTIAEMLDDSYKTNLVTSNAYLTNGLDEGFDRTIDLLKKDYLLFDEGPDPQQFVRENQYGSPIETYGNFLLKSGNPIKALFNGIGYKLWDRKRESSILKSVDDDDENYQYANTMGEYIRSVLEAGSNEFVVANYMDAHPPLDASDEAIAAVSPYPRSDLPIGVRGQDVHEAILDGDEQLGDKMRALYHASIWDLDRKVVSLIRDLIENDTFVVLTADHGQWFYRTSELEESRIHVPLILFSPNHEPDTISRTANIISLPKTTLEAIGQDTASIPGHSLFDSKSVPSITEFIRPKEQQGKPITPHGGLSPDEIRHDIVAIQDGARVNLTDGEFERVSGTEAECDALIETIEEIRRGPVNYGGKKTIEYDKRTEDRLEELGYL